MNYQEVITSNIKELRYKNGLTQEQFAEKLGITVNGVSNIERNCYQPTAKMIDKICSAFSIFSLQKSYQNDTIINVK